MGTGHEEKQPILTVHGAKGGGGTSRRAPEDEDCCVCGFGSIICGGIILAVLFSIVAPIWYLCQIYKSLEYSVAISGVSGLDPVTDLQHGRLNPEFNLTIGITSPSDMKAGCIQPRTYIEVSYSHLRIPMAVGRAPEMCAGPRQSSEPRQVVARGHDLALPPCLLDSLAEDIRHGGAMFEIVLTALEPEDEDDKLPCKIVTCWAKLGDATGTAFPCVVTWGAIHSGTSKQDSSCRIPTAGPH